MKKINIMHSFTDESRDLCVVVTVTNWNEPPRIRHEVSFQLSRKYNVLYLQLHQNNQIERPIKKINEHLIVDRVGFGFRGIGRLFTYFPGLLRAHNRYLANQIQLKLNHYARTDYSILVNFQYDFPEVFELTKFSKKIYFCNDDFVNQNISSSEKEVQRKDKLQSSVVEVADSVITVSYPLKTKLEKYGKDAHVILSGHNFNINISRNFVSEKREKIHVCYMGFLNNGIAIDWLEFILKNKRIHLTIIGPIEVPGFKKRIEKFSNATHIPQLSGLDLQMMMLNQDIMLMPYSSPIENAVTTVPAKLFQYLAVGKPIVSSSMENLIKLPDGFVYKSNNKEAFLSNIFVALDNDNELLRYSRIQESSLHTWNAKGNELFKVLAK